ncbi:hypothetical protein [Sphingosinicella sp.]|jgi:hypothetical protein|nr:hypothetical protein [Sphingosinicella sp.]
MDVQNISDFMAVTDKRLEMLPGVHYFQETAKHRDAALRLMAGWFREMF